MMRFLRTFLLLFSSASFLLAQDTDHQHEGIKVDFKILTYDEKDHSSTIQLNIDAPENYQIIAFSQDTTAEYKSEVATALQSGITVGNIKQNSGLIKSVFNKDLESNISIYTSNAISVELDVDSKKQKPFPAVSTVNLDFFFVNQGRFGATSKKLRIPKSAFEEVSAKINLKDKKSTSMPLIGGSGQSPTSLWLIFILALVGGFIAILTPCIYAMVPLTVSFFLKKSKTSREAIKNSFLYSLCIILIFTLLGTLITSLFGPTALNYIATNSIANFAFFAIFFAFSLSFFGLFEITLPSSWATKSSTLSGGTDLLGIFFMALTLVIVSFSCTGPIIGNLIVLAANGPKLAPLVGFLGFSIALAIPFFFFSVFPSKLDSILKAGSWLNSVKVTLGFLELALAMKFLSNVDLALGLRMIDREVFLAIWIIIFLLLGLYHIGALRFKQDNIKKNDYGLHYISIPSLMLIIASWSFVIYLLPGMWGSPLKAVSAFLPPMGTQDFRTITTDHQFTKHKTRSQSTEHIEKKYEKQMAHLEPDVVKQYNLNVYFDYKQALEQARKEKKPLMLDFTGVNCVNCRKMEAEVWSNNTVASLLRDSFVIASLYIDVHNVYLEKEDQSISDEGDPILTIGEKYANMQIKKFGANVQPYYFFLDKQEHKIVNTGYGYNSDVNAFIELLKGVLKKYHTAQLHEPSK